MIPFLFEKIKPATTHPLLRKVMPQALWQVTTNEKVVYLTFDDGPQKGVTRKVLDILKQYSARATFFCIGENVVKHPEIYQEIIEAGHAIGNHTFNHLMGSKTDNQLYFQNIDECEKFVESKLFRPPFGRMKNSQYNYLKKDYKIVMWSILSWDFDHNFSPNKCAKKVLDNIQNGSIIVFHDSKKAERNCIPALEQVLNTLSKEGYNFLPLTEN